MKEQILVTYKGMEYVVTDYMSQHPGGRQLFENYLKNDRNITEVFKSMHSPSAEQILLQLPKKGKVERNKNQKIYLKIEERVNRLYSCSYFYQATYMLITAFMYALGLWIIAPVISIFFLTVSQILAAWIAHSQLHSHNSFQYRSGKLFGGIILGLSYGWWKKKHLCHHLFTNIQNLDEDIGHRYRPIIFPFVILKWRIESIWFNLSHLSLLQIVMLFLHYYFISYQKIAFVVLSSLISSFYINLVVWGSHEREKRYCKGQMDNFLQHQLETTTDYGFGIDGMQILLGGFQFHTEHHLFPQVPFYSLKKAKKIIDEQLQIYKKEVKISRMI